MTSIEKRAAVFDPFFDKLQSVRGARHRATAGGVRVEYSKTVQRDNVITLEQLNAIDTLKDVPERDKFMARLALSDFEVTHGDLLSQRTVLREGLVVLDRVYEQFQDGSPVAARIEKDGVTLYPSRGAEDLRTTDERDSSAGFMGRMRWLNVHYENGIRVVVDANFDNMIREDEFPKPIGIIGALNARDHLNSDGHLTNDLFHHLRKWDPDHPDYNPPIIRLGTPEQPTDMSRLVVTDNQRFSFRAAAELMNQSDWLTVERPSDNFRDRLIREFAYTYWDILAFGEPYDTHEQRIMHQGVRGRVAEERRSQRTKSLVDYTTRELGAIHHGAGVSFDQIVDATEEIINKKKSKADTKRKEYRVLRAKRDFERFFS